MESLIYDHTSNTEVVLENYACQILKEKRSFILYTNPNSTYQNFTKKFIMSVIQFALFMNLNNFVVFIDRKSNDYETLFRSLLTTGFSNADDFNYEPENYRVLKTAIQRREKDEPLEEVPVLDNFDNDDEENNEELIESNKEENKDNEKEALILNDNKSKASEEK